MNSQGSIKTFVPFSGTAEQGIAEEEAMKKGRESKSKECVEKGVEVYAKA